jgi:pimeloyl-ACP methyl ester carboxylesterase
MKTSKVWGFLSRARWGALLLAAGLSFACGDDGKPAEDESSEEPRADMDIAGTWVGTVEVPPAPLRVVFNIEGSAESSWSGTADSPDEGAIGIPITRIDVSGERVEVRIDSMGVVFSGEVSSDEQTLTGTVEQGGESFPLSLERQPGPLDYRRPQDPVAPFPYNEADVSFPSDEPGVTLAGTLTWPQGPGPFTTVVLITGSGPQNRNEELLNHRPFLVLADALVRANVAVLRYDDRGFAESTGEFDAATTFDFVADARGAVSYLRSQTELEVGEIGLVGHSEGGLIAPLVADGSTDVGFLVLLAGPGVDGKTLLVSQSRAIGAANGASGAELDANETLQVALYGCFGDPDDALSALDACLRAELTKVGVSGEQLASILAQLEMPWMREFVVYDPAPVLRRTQVPVLALNGSLDLQVLASVNVPALERAFREGGNAQAVVEELPGLNHLFQHAITGAPSEYPRIDETIAPEVLSRIAEWIEQVPASAP